jgi:DNA-binding transcriptional MerR regulator
MPRGQKSRTRRRALLPEILIPDKLYFRIKEVSALTDTKAYVLRYWETEFPTLKPERKSGQRLYRRADVETVFRIKQLLYQQGFTIEGARKQLESESKASVQSGPLLRSLPDGTELRGIRRELESILTMLSRKC